jgi:hypothetical protein
VKKSTGKVEAMYLMRTGVRLMAVVATSACLTLNAQTTLPVSSAVTPSGGASYSIPIEAPAGRAGLSPKFGLSYGSQGGNGLLGVGWALSGLSSISRCPQTMAQDEVRGSVNFDASDRFCLDGQRLVADSGVYGASGSSYKTASEAYLFAKSVVTADVASGPTYFIVKTKDGLTREFGRTSDSRVMAKNGQVVREWNLNAVSDGFGNSYSIKYSRDAVTGEVLPARVDYAATSSSMSIQFEYQVRPDNMLAYWAGEISKTTKRLSAIKVCAANFTEVCASASTIYAYSVEYKLSAMTGRSQVARIKLCTGGGVCVNDGKLVWTDQSFTGSYLADSKVKCNTLGFNESRWSAAGC